MLLAYCVRRAGDPGPEPGLTGVDGAAVRLLEAGGVGFWLSEGAGGRPAVERLRDHDRVVRSALRTATPLPVRFGTRFADADAAREALVAGREPFLAGLDRVSGRVEMGLRVLWQPPPPGEDAAGGEPGPPEPAGPGRAYLEGRRRARAADERLRARAAERLREVEGFFENFDFPAVHSVLPEPEVAGTVAHLVHRDLLRQYRECVERARNGCFEIRLHATGPWAPYSFV